MVKIVRVFLSSLSFLAAIFIMSMTVDMRAEISYQDAWICVIGITFCIVVGCVVIIYDQLLTNS